jgi:alpha/beta superfamily hydrolase
MPFQATQRDDWFGKMQMTESVTIACGDLTLEGCLEGEPSGRGVVVTHPHPLYGGDMHNAVAVAIAEAYRQAGYLSLRFNFRGVGRSQGRHEEGRGEQADVLAALEWMQQRGCRRIVLAGYSFGAWVNAMAASRAGWLQRLVLVSPPVAFIPFTGVAFLAPLKLVVTGGCDSFAPPARIRDLMPTWNPDADLAVIDAADHFYSGCLAQLKEHLANHEETTCPPPP